MLLFCLSAASRPNPTIVSYETRTPHAALQPYRHQRISRAVDPPSSVSARLEHGAGAVRSSQPALATPRVKQHHAQARRYGMAPKGLRVVPNQSARRVALPSSPAETLRLCEPYGMPTPTVCAWSSAKCHDPSAPSSGSHGAKGETPCLDDSMWYWYLCQVSYISGQIGGSK